MTLLGLSVKPVRTGAKTLRVAEEEPFRDVLMVTAVSAATATVLTWKPALLLPAGTVTVVAVRLATAALLVDRPTTIPPEGAG